MATLQSPRQCCGKHGNAAWQRYSHHGNAAANTATQHGDATVTTATLRQTRQRSMATLQTPWQRCINRATQHGDATITTTMLCQHGNTAWQHYNHHGNASMATLQSPWQCCINMAMLQTAWNRNAAIPHQYCNHNDIIVNVFKEMLRLQFKIKFYGSHTYNYYT